MLVGERELYTPRTAAELRDDAAETEQALVDDAALQQALAARVGSLGVLRAGKVDEVLQRRLKVNKVLQLSWQGQQGSAGASRSTRFCRGVSKVNKVRQRGASSSTRF